MAIPFVIPRCVSGPDYPYAERWRRRDDEHFKAPICTPGTLMRSFTERIERSVVTDWTAVPIVRSVWCKYTVE